MMKVRFKINTGLPEILKKERNRKKEMWGGEREAKQKGKKEDRKERRRQKEKMKKITGGKQ